MENAASGDATVQALMETIEQGLDAYEQFQRAEPAKRQRIIRAALEEFAANSYAIASTNTIVARAGIAKGLLFHYFKDKAGLFHYLQLHVSQVFLGEYINTLSKEGDVLFDLLKGITEEKLRLTAVYDLETRFFVRAYSSDLPAELREPFDVLTTGSFDTLAAITANIDEARLKAGINKDKAVKLINWVFAGMTAEMIAGFNADKVDEDFEELAVYVGDCCDFLRDLLYQPQEEGNRS
jgi:AcrR family transcriptional regulator